MTAFLGISVATLFCALILRDKNRAFSVIISLTGSLILLFLLISRLGAVVNKVVEIASFSPSSKTYVALMLKVLGITLLTGFVSSICRDNGEGALASVTETLSKVIIITLVLPLFEAVITIVGNILK